MNLFWRDLQRNLALLRSLPVSCIFRANSGLFDDHAGIDNYQQKLLICFLEAVTRPDYCVAALSCIDVARNTVSIKLCHI